VIVGWDPGWRSWPWKQGADGLAVMLGAGVCSLSTGTGLLVPVALALAVAVWSRVGAGSGRAGACSYAGRGKLALTVAVMPRWNVGPRRQGDRRCGRGCLLGGSRGRRSGAELGVTLERRGGPGRLDVALDWKSADCGGEDGLSGLWA